MLSTVGSRAPRVIGVNTQIWRAALPVLDETELRGVRDRFAARVRAELAEDRRDVVSDRLLGEEEALRDLGVAKPLDDES